MKNISLWVPVTFGALFLLVLWLFPAVQEYMLHPFGLLGIAGLFLALLYFLAFILSLIILLSLHSAVVKAASSRRREER